MWNLCRDFWAFKHRKWNIFKSIEQRKRKTPHSHSLIWGIIVFSLACRLLINRHLSPIILYSTVHPVNSVDQQERFSTSTHAFLRKINVALTGWAGRWALAAFLPFMHVVTSDVLYILGPPHDKCVSLLMSRKHKTECATGDALLTGSRCSAEQQ